eukprot:3327040-Pyramimonas_sp.AAC.1
MFPAPRMPVSMPHTATWHCTAHRPVTQHHAREIMAVQRSILACLRECLPALMTSLPLPDLTTTRAQQRAHARS